MTQVVLLLCIVTVGVILALLLPFAIALLLTVVFGGCVGLVSHTRG